MEEIIETLRKQKQEGILQSELSEKLDLSKSTISHHLSELEKEEEIVRKNIGNSKRVWIKDKAPKPLKDKIRIGIVRAAEYPHVMLAADDIEYDVLVSVYDSAKETTKAVVKGEIDIALSPLLTQSLYSLLNNDIKIYAGCAKGGSGVIARNKLTKQSNYGSSHLSTMEMNLKNTLENQDISFSDIKIKYFKNPGKAYRDFLRKNIDTVSIWEPYLSLIQSSSNSLKTYKNRGPCCSLAINKEFIKPNKEIFKQFIDSYKKATIEINKNKSLKKAANLLSDKTGFNTSLLMKSFDKYEFRYKLDKKEIKNHLDNFTIPNSALSKVCESKLVA